MKLSQALTTLLLAGSIVPAQAGFVIDFEDATNGPNPLSEFTNIGETYKAKHNVIFEGEVKSVQGWEHCVPTPGVVGSCDAAGNFTGGAEAPLFRSQKGAAGLFGQAVDGDPFGRGEFTINVIDGFEGMFSLLWGSTASASAESRLDIYDALDGEGTVLNSIRLGPQNPANGGDITTWSSGAAQFAGKAYSVVFRISPNEMFIDDLGFGSRDGNNVPEPTGLALSAAALAALGLIRRRRT